MSVSAPLLTAVLVTLLLLLGLLITRLLILPMRQATWMAYGKA